MKKLITAIILTLILTTQAFALDVVRLGPEYFPDPTRSGAIGNGYIYVGLPDLDPTVLANQKQVTIQQEDGTLVEVTQPLRTNSGGVPVYSGSPVTLLVSGDYSLAILSSSMAQKYYVPSSTGGGSATASFYYIDSSETDQGVIGNGSTAKAFSDIAGTDFFTLVFRNDSGAGTTAYNFDTTLDLSSKNVKVEFENGAYLTGSGRFVLPDGSTYFSSWRQGDIPYTISDIGTNVDATLNIDNQVILDSSVDLSSNPNIKVKIDNGFDITLGTYDFDFGGQDPEAGPYKIFVQESTGAVSGINKAYSEWWGENTIPGTTDMGQAIQYADDAVAGRQGRVEFFAEDYLFSTAVIKDAYSQWKGFKGSQTPQIGTNLVNGQSDDMITITESSTVNSGNAGFEDLRMVNDLSTYANAVAINYTSVVRRQVIEDVYIFGFLYGIEGLVYEQYHERVFISGCSRGVNATAAADSWFNNSHYGSGIGATGVTSGTGFRVENGNNLHFSLTRYQVQEGGQGFFAKNSTNLTFNGPIADQNESFGMQFQNCQDVKINNAEIFDNGTIATPSRGLVFQTTVNDSFVDGDVTVGSDTINLPTHGIQNTNLIVQVANSGGALPTGLSASTDYWVIRVDADNIKLAASQEDALAGTPVDITAAAGGGTHELIFVASDLLMSNSVSKDRNYGTSDKVQETGIFLSTGSASGILRDITIHGNNLQYNDNPISGTSSIDSGKNIKNNLGWITENRGSSTVASGATVVAVNHGCSETPNIVNITMTENATNDIGYWWVSAIGATTFNLNVRNDPGASNQNFSWEAKVR